MVDRDTHHRRLREQIELHIANGYNLHENGKKDQVSERNVLNDLTGKEWIVETKSFWFQKGLGAQHEHAQIERQHPAPFSYQDVMRLIAFFTKADMTVLDPFVGVGSTLKAAALLGRNGIGIELIQQWFDLARRRLLEEVGPDSLGNQHVIQGDARTVLSDRSRFPDESVDFIVTSPPYWGILSKSPDHKVRSERVANGLATDYGDHPNDLSNIQDYSRFLDEVCKVFFECSRVLRKGQYICIIVSDFRHKSQFVPYHADLIQRLISPATDNCLILQGVTILAQNQKRLYPYGYPYAYVSNIHHQYILIFRRPKEPKG